MDMACSGRRLGHRLGASQEQGVPLLPPGIEHRTDQPTAAKIMSQDLQEETPTTGKSGQGQTLDGGHANAKPVKEPGPRVTAKF